MNNINNKKQAIAKAKKLEIVINELADIYHNMVEQVEELEKIDNAKGRVSEELIDAKRTTEKLKFALEYVGVEQINICKKFNFILIV